MKAFVGVTDNDWFAFLAGLPEIAALLKNGSRTSFIARRYGVFPGTLTHRPKRESLDKLEPQP